MAEQYGNWRIVDPIGEGGQNHVFKAEDVTGEHKGLFALKRLKNRKRLGRFKREVEARTALNIYGIPRIVDVDLDSERPYLVEVLYKTGNMSENRVRFEGDLLKTLEYFAQVCGVIAEAHSAPNAIVHRDIKPQNILYNELSDDFAVTDFGICFIIDKESGERFTLLDEQVGPRNFIAPELERGGEAAVTPQADVYSLGKLLFWMLTGKNVFREEHRSPQYSLAQVVRNRHYERILRLLDRCLVEQPSRRFQTAGALLNEVRRTTLLIKQMKNVVDIRIYQKCNYCGLGNCDVVAAWDPSLEEKRPNNYQASKEEFEAYGYRLEQRTKSKCHLTKCDYCGHMELFCRDVENRSWEDPSYLPEDRDID